MKLRRTAPEYNGCPIDKVQYLDNCRYIFTVLIFRCVWNMHSRDWTTTPSCPTTRRTDPTSSTRRAATPCTWRWMQPRSPRVQTSRYQSSSPVTTAVLPRVSRYIFLDILISTYIYGQHTYLHNLHLSKAKWQIFYFKHVVFYSDDPSSAQMVEGKEAARDSALGLSLVTETAQGVTQELTAGVWIPLWIKSVIKGR